MKSKNRWPDFLFTIAVRVVTGFLSGGFACFMILWKGVLRSFSQNDSRVPLYLMLGCGILGSLAAVLTIPDWQTPWYKGLHGKRRAE